MGNYANRLTPVSERQDAHDVTPPIRDRVVEAVENFERWHWARACRS